MPRQDKATLRLAIGMGFAVLIAYGAAMPLPFCVCVMAVLVLCKPGPPLTLRNGIVAALCLATLLTSAVLLVPILENYAFTGILLIAAILYAVFRFGPRISPVATTILAMTFALMPIAGVMEQALVSALSITLATGMIVGVVVAAFAHALFPDPPAPTPAVTTANVEPQSWVALRATLIVMPVCILALTNPPLYIAAIMKTIALSQQANETHARGAGSELVGSTFAGALIAAALWLGLSLLANLWMLTLWMMLASLWVGARMFGVRPSKYRPSFWSNALVTALILFGPAIEDSASGKSVGQAALIRTALFIAIAFYAWGMVYFLERLHRRPAVASVFANENS